MRAPGRSGRGHPGVALPSRQDGRADDRHQAWNRRIGGRRVSARDCWAAALSRPVDDPVSVLDSKRERNHRRRFDLHPGTVVQQRGHLHQRHRGKVPANHTPVGLPHFARSGHVLTLVGDVPGQADQVLGPGVGFRKDVDDVPQGLLDLRDEIVVDNLLVCIRTDLAGHEDLAALRGDAVGEAFRGCPVLRVEEVHILRIDLH